MNIIERPTLGPQAKDALAAPLTRASAALSEACAALNLPPPRPFLPTTDLSTGDLTCDLRGPWAAHTQTLAQAAGARAVGGGRFLIIDYDRAWLAAVAWPALITAEPKKTWVPNVEMGPSAAGTHVFLDCGIEWTVAEDDEVCWRLLRALVSEKLGAPPALVAAAYNAFYRGTIIADRDARRRAVKEALAGIAVHV